MGVGVSDGGWDRKTAFLQITILVINYQMTNQSNSVSAPSTSTPDPDIEILPALPKGDEWSGDAGDITLPERLEFEPVELRGARGQITAMKQRVFIRVLAETGRVALAAKAAGNTPAAFLLSAQPAEGAKLWQGVGAGAGFRGWAGYRCPDRSCDQRHSRICLPQRPFGGGAAAL